jgi:hypothetical protein
LGGQDLGKDDTGQLRDIRENALASELQDSLREKENAEAAN